MLRALRALVASWVARYLAEMLLELFHNNSMDRHLHHRQANKKSISILLVLQIPAFHSHT